MTGWLIALGIVLLLLGLLLMPLVMTVEHDDSQGHSFWKLSWLGISLCSSEKKGLFQRSPRKKSEKHKKKEKPKNAEKSRSRTPKQYWETFRDVTGILPRPLRMLWKGISIRGLEIMVQVGRFDAKECAVAYGMTNAMVYTSLGVLQSTMRVKVRRVFVQCAFGQEESQWTVRGKVHFCPLAAVAALFSFAIGYLMQQQRRDVPPQGTHQKKQFARTGAEK